MAPQPPLLRLSVASAAILYPRTSSHIDKGTSVQEFQLLPGQVEARLEELSALAFGLSRHEDGGNAGVDQVHIGKEFVADLGKNFVSDVHKCT